MAFKDTEVDKIEVLFSKFDEYCEPRKNITMERYKFNTPVQRSDETPDEYVTELKLRAKNCEFGALESELIQDRVVYGITSERVKERLLREQDLTLDKALELCRINEQSKEQMKVLHEAQGVNAIRQQNTKTKTDRGKFDANRRRDFKRDKAKNEITFGGVENVATRIHQETALRLVKRVITVLKAIISPNFANLRRKCTQWTE